MTEPTPAQLLAIPMGENDAQAETIGDYLINLLATVWEEGAEFSGKRPFGNSGWQHDLYTALAMAGRITADLDEDGEIEGGDASEGHRLIAEAIETLKVSRAVTPELVAGIDVHACATAVAEWRAKTNDFVGIAEQHQEEWAHLSDDDHGKVHRRVAELFRAAIVTVTWDRDV